jgi:hypothetical protein
MQKAGSAPPRLSGERLESWKEIASYLNRDVRTVERWERQGLRAAPARGRWQRPFRAST